MIRSRSMTDKNLLGVTDAAKAVQMANDGAHGNGDEETSSISSSDGPLSPRLSSQSRVDRQSGIKPVRADSRNSGCCGYWSSDSERTSLRSGAAGSAKASCPGGSAISSRFPKLSTRAMFYICLLSFIAISIFNGAFNPSPLDEHKRPVGKTGSIHAREVTVVMNTFKRPPEMLDDAVEYYSQCDLVKYIKIIWSEPQDPPVRLSKKYATWKMPLVDFEKHDSDSLNNRFKPLQTEHTDAIFAVDDDMRVPCNDLDTAFEVWQHSPYSLVGFMPRVHLRKNGLLEYRCWWRVWWHGVYSIILTKAAFINKSFLDLYTNKMPQEIRDLIDRERNCEDIAMQFLIANETRLPPVYVKGHLQDLGVLSGISTSRNIAKAAHMDGRSFCLNALSEVYHGVPLISSRIIVDSANNGWVNAPSSWWEFISSDLWAGFWT